MNLIKNIFLQFLISILLLIAIEYIISLIYKNSKLSPLENFILSVPEPFKNDENFHIILNHFNGKCSYPALLNIDGISKYAKDFSCSGVTYQDEKRVTLPSIDDYKKTIHLFGGSTVWGTGSTDENTIPSLLSLKLENQKIRVLNYGFASYVSSQQNNLLKAKIKDFKEGDIVIYYDGGNDFWNGVMLGNFNGSIIGFNSKNRIDVYVYIIRNWLSKNSSTYNLLSDLKNGRNSKTSLNCSVNSEYAESNILSAAQHYANQIAFAKSYNESKGMKFYHFLQPTLFDVDKLNNYEQMLLSQNPCWAKAREHKEKYDQEFLSLSPSTIDLSEVFNNKNFFFDYIHVSAKGNRNIVNYIYENIFK